MKQYSQWSQLGLLSIALVFLAGCGATVEAPETTEMPDEKEEMDIAMYMEDDMTEEDMQALEAAAAMPANETAKYRVEFQATWSAETHPEQYDASAHFSPFIVHTHDGSEEGRTFVLGGEATEGVEVMAETGKPAPLEAEIDAKIEAGSALTRTRGSRIDSPGVDDGMIEVNQSHPHLSFVSMLAPSPDWFVTGNVQLFTGNYWKPRVVLDLTTLDSGTDSGETLTAGDIDSEPREEIRTAAAALQNLGQVVLIRVE